MATKTDSPMVCIMPFTTELDGIPVTVPGGARRDASDPLVKRFPDFFAPENKPSEIERKRKAAWAEAIAVVPDPAPVATLLTPMLKAKKNINVDLDDERRTVRRGELLSVGDPLGALLPSKFERVMVEG